MTRNEVFIDIAMFTINRINSLYDQCPTFGDAVVCFAAVPIDGAALLTVLTSDEGLEQIRSLQCAST